mgnify:CR=1 FL=1
MPTAPRYKREKAEPTEATATANLQAREMQSLEDGFLLEIEDPDPGRRIMNRSSGRTEQKLKTIKIHTTQARNA